MSKVIIAGGRDFQNTELLQEEMFYLQQTLDVDEIVSGGARGADKLGEIWAGNDTPVTPFPADWDLHGKAAGYIRNKEMAEYADVLVAFWDGKSKGTKHMIDLALAGGLLVKVVKYSRRRISGLTL